MIYPYYFGSPTEQSGLPMGRRILTITDSGGFALITTAAAHGLSALNTISITGNSVAGYNDNHEVQTTPTATTFTTDISYTSAGTGGTWTLT